MPESPFLESDSESESVGKLREKEAGSLDLDTFTKTSEFGDQTAVAREKGQNGRGTVVSPVGFRTPLTDLDAPIHPQRPLGAGTIAEEGCNGPLASKGGRRSPAAPRQDALQVEYVRGVKPAHQVPFGSTVPDEDSDEQEEQEGASVSDEEGRW